MPLKFRNENYYEPKEVAIVLNRHHYTVLRYINDGDLNATKISASYLISHSDLVSYLAEVESLPANVIEMRLKSSA